MDGVGGAGSKQPRPLRVAFLGDSLTQGTQDGTTHVDRQVHGYADVVSKALGAEYSTAYLSGGGIPFNAFADGTLDMRKVSKQARNLEIALAPLAVYTAFVGAPPWVPALWKLAGEGRRLPTPKGQAATPQTDFAVPGFKARHLLTIRSEKDMLAEVHQGLMDPKALAQEVPLTRAILQDGSAGKVVGSAVDQVVATQPDIAFVWAGANDALHSLMDGYIDDAKLTPIKDQPYTVRRANPLTGRRTEHTTGVMPGYESVYLGSNGIMDRLLKDTTADIFLMTIPQASVTPSMAPLGQKLGTLPFKVKLKDGTDATKDLENWVLPTGVQGAGKGGRTQFPAGSQIAVIGALTGVLGKLHTAADLHRFLANPPAAIFTEDEVADPDELTMVHDRIEEFNDVIRRAGSLSPRAHVLDLNALLEQVHTQGHELSGDGPNVKVTTTFTGAPVRDMDGIFSYDGLHPSDTGHAIIANYVLDGVKQALAGKERFAAVQGAQSIDEKAAYANDPHHLLAS